MFSYVSCNVTDTSTLVLISEINYVQSYYVTFVFCTILKMQRWINIIRCEENDNILTLKILLERLDKIKEIFKKIEKLSKN